MKPIEKPFTPAELKAMLDKDGHVQAVVSLPWDDTSDIEALNDNASTQITGDEGALVDIGYRLVGADVEKQEVLVEVTASIDHEWFEDNGIDDDESDQASTFYADDGIGTLTLVVKDGAVYGQEEGESDAYLGEYDAGRFVPSNLLLRSTPGFQDWVDQFARANQPN